MTKLSDNELMLNNNSIKASNNSITVNDIPLGKKNHTHTANQINDLIDIFYPIGTIFQSYVNTNPGTYIPGTTWESIRGRFLFAEDDAHPINMEGGEFEHQLTVDEMPSHNHWIKLTGDGGLDAGRGSRSDRWNGSNVARTNYVGGDKPHNNMPPYISVYMWHRTA